MGEGQCPASDDGSEGEDDDGSEGEDDGSESESDNGNNSGSAGDKLDEESTVTPVITGTCSSGRYVSIDERATNAWCQNACMADEENCYGTGFCLCSDEHADSEGGSLVLSI